MKLAVLSAGAPRHGRAITQQWQSIADEKGWGWELEFWDWEKDGYDSRVFSSVDWCIWIGCFERCFEWMAREDETKHMALWVGTDLLQHLSLVQRGYPDPFGAARLHVADAPHLVSEAAQLTGREVGYVRSIPPEAYSPTPITRWDHILGYVPAGREPFFRYDWILDVAADYPDITFDILAREASKEDPENVVAHLEVSGRQKRELFEQSFCYLRPIEHDGVGLTLVEAAQWGRFVFHSDTRIHGAIPARSVGEIEFQLDEILKHKRGPDEGISEYYRREYGRDKLAEDLGRLRARLEQTL